MAKIFNETRATRWILWHSDIKKNPFLPGFASDPADELYLRRSPNPLVDWRGILADSLLIPNPLDAFGVEDRCLRHWAYLYLLSVGNRDTQFPHSKFWEYLSPLPLYLRTWLTKLVEIWYCLCTFPLRASFPPFSTPLPPFVTTPLSFPLLSYLLLAA